MSRRSISAQPLLPTWRGWVAAIPGVCAICGAWPAQTFCRTCTDRFASTAARCRCCAAPLPPAAGTVCGGCRLRPPPLDRCVAAVAWGWPWSDFIARFKFGRDPGWAGPLAGLLAASAGVEAVLRDIDLLLPVPLSAARLRDRGFNQSLLLARRLAPGKTDAGALRRLHHAAPQASLDRAARLVNVRGAFGVDPARESSVAGRRVALLDDVMTTGATLFEAARVLRQAGAVQVTALVLARNDDAPLPALQPAIATPSADDPGR